MLLGNRIWFTNYHSIFVFCAAHSHLAQARLTSAFRSGASVLWPPHFEYNLKLIHPLSACVTSLNIVCGSFRSRCLVAALEYDNLLLLLSFSVITFKHQVSRMFKKKYHPKSQTFVWRMADLHKIAINQLLVGWLLGWIFSFISLFETE